MDFSAKTGTPIYATGDGRISRADNRAVGFGNHVRIDHGFGYVSIYAHMSKIEVRRGNKVKRGDLIGYVGNTGRSVAPHLHYAVGFGNHVRIDHGFGYVSIYAHMSKIEVRRGNKVKRGDLIGYVGNTGRSVAPHLHYEIVKDGRKINPINFYTGSLTPLEFEKLVNQASQENQSLD